MKLILIGGVPRTGKTTLAQRLASDLNISWISTDTLESIAHSYTPDEEKNNKFPKSVMRRNTNRNNDEFYTTYSITEIIDSYQTQAQTVSTAITALVEYANKEDWDYVIEGYHVTPTLMAELYDSGIDFSSIILINSDPAKAIERSRGSDVKNDWVRDNTTNEETFAKICEGIQEHSERLAKEAEELGIQSIDMSKNFSDKAKDVYKLLTN